MCIRDRCIAVPMSCLSTVFSTAYSVYCLEPSVKKKKKTITNNNGRETNPKHFSVKTEMKERTHNFKTDYYSSSK